MASVPCPPLPAAPHVGADPIPVVTGGVSHQGDEVGEGELEGDIDDLVPTQGRAQVPVVVGHEVLEQLLLLVPAAHTWGGHVPWGHPRVGTVGTPMPPGPASVGLGGMGCAWGGDTHACVTVGVHTQLRVPDCAPVPQRVSGGVCIPSPPHPPCRSPQGPLQGRTWGQQAASTGTRQWDGAQHCTPVGDKPPRAKAGGDRVLPQVSPRDGHPLPARAQRARRRLWQRMVVPWGARAGASLAVGVAGLWAGARWDRTAVPCHRQLLQAATGPGRDG